MFASIPYSAYHSNNWFFLPSSSPSASASPSSPSVSTYINSDGLKNKSISMYCILGFSNMEFAGTNVVNPLPTLVDILLMILNAVLDSLPLGEYIVLSTARMYCLLGLVVIIFLTNLATSTTWMVGMWFMPSFITFSSEGSCSHACLNQSKRRSSPWPNVSPQATT